MLTKPRLELTRTKWSIAVISMTAFLIVSLLEAPIGMGAYIRGHNLFNLVSGLGQTTDSMLGHTKELAVGVNHVGSQLNQLTVQESLLQQQINTGQDLANQLALQQSLTGQSVSLMGQILQRQEFTSKLVGNVAGKAQDISASVSQNVPSLTQLAEYLDTTNIESNHLNGQLDSLLQELSVSIDEFKFFGHIRQLLIPLNQANPLQGLGNAGVSRLHSLPDSLGGSQHSVGHSLTSTLSPAISQIPQNATTQLQGGLGNITQSLLGSLR